MDKPRLGKPNKFDYLNPPENALVLSVDEKTSIQALEKNIHHSLWNLENQKELTMNIHHGTKSLIAALLVHNGEVTGKCYDRHRHQEFLDFLEIIENHFPNKELHLIVDNLSVYRHKKVKEHLTKHKNVYSCTLLLLMHPDLTK